MPSPSLLKRMKRMFSRDNLGNTSPTSSGTLVSDTSASSPYGSLSTALTTPTRSVPFFETTEPSNENLHLARDTVRDPYPDDKDLPPVPPSRSSKSGPGEGPENIQSELRRSSSWTALPRVTYLAAPALPSFSFEDVSSINGLPGQAPAAITSESPYVRTEATRTLVRSASVQSSASVAEARLSHLDDSLLVSNAIDLAEEQSLEETADVTAMSIAIRARPGCILVNSVINTVDGVESLAEDVSNNSSGTTLPTIALFIKALDELANIHPFVQVAVIAFKAVYLVSEKHVENDSNVKALRDEMKSLMEVLLRLRGLRSEQITGPDGTTVDPRLRSLIEHVKADIEFCGNAIETYQQQPLIIKVAKSILWSAHFSSLASKFAMRRGEFLQELVLYTALRVDVIDANTSDTKAYLERVIRETHEGMMRMFEERMTAAQRQLLLYMQQNGGVTAFDTEETIKLLIKQWPNSDEPEMRLNGHRPRRKKRAVGRDGYNRAKKRNAGGEDDARAKKIFQELSSSIEAAEEKNMERFSQRLQIKIDRLEHEMKEEYARQTARIIDVIRDGAYQRIQDEDVRAIWQEMQWKGNVKARHFILALKDYYHEQMERAKDQGSHDPSDDWTSPYINVPYLQPILEAFDDDASGFITIAEVNKFIHGRPEGWSLRHWITYWAAGWVRATAEQAREIEVLFAKMFGLLPEVLPTNAFSASCYLETIWQPLFQLTQPLTSRNSAPDIPYNNFTSYVEQEQRRLEVNLEKVNYVIDRDELVFDITGEGRIEKYSVPLILLLLRKHHGILRLACEQPLPETDFFTASESLSYVLHAIRERYHDLELTFTQQRYDLKQHFRSFAYGFFRYLHEPEELWSLEHVKHMEFPVELPSVTTKVVINVQAMMDYALEDDMPPLPASDPIVQELTAQSLSQPCAIGHLLGTWYCSGFSEPTSDMTETFMRKMNFEHDASSSSGTRFTCSSISYSGQRFTVSGSCVAAGANTTAVVDFTVTYLDCDINSLPYYSGEYDATRQVINGTCGWQSDPLTHKATFTMTRSDEILRLWPSPSALQENRYRALWQFSINVTRSRVRRPGAWNYIKTRQQHGKKWMDWHVRRDLKLEKLTNSEERDYQDWGHQLTFRELCMLTVHRWTRDSLKLDHPEFHICSHCGTSCSLHRVTCLECESRDNPFHTVDLCLEDRSCEAATIDTKARTDLSKPHLPTHDVMKLRRLVLERQYPAMYRLAKAALGRAKVRVKSLVAQPESSAEAKRSSTIPLQCFKCEQALTLPCWYCAECAGDVFICNTCDSGGSVHQGSHSGDHTLVKCHTSKSESTGMSLEKKVANLEQVVTQAFYGVREHLSAVDERIERLEELLRTFVMQNSRASST